MMSRRLTLSVVALLWLSASFLSAQPPETPASEDADAANGIPTEEEDTSRVTDLPLLEELPIPTMKELLHGEPVAWIILNVDRVVVSRPIKPRPNTLESLAETLAELRRQPPVADPQKRKIQLDERKKYQVLRGGFPGAAENPEFIISVDVIEAIWHHEDLMLKRSDLLVEEGNLADAFELLFALQRINSDWPGLKERHERVVLLDGNQFLEQDNAQAALARYEELHKLNSSYEGVAERLGVATNSIVEAAVAEDDYRRARHFLHRLEARYPEHQVVEQWSDRLQKQVQETLSAATTAEQSGELAKAADLAREATRYWPYASDLRLNHRRIAQRYQTLRAGVLLPAGTPHAYPLTLDSDIRFQNLRQRPLFEVSYIDDTPHYRTGWLDNWEPTELGRQIEFDMRTSFDYWDSREQLTAIELARLFRRQLDPGHADFDERLSGFISRVTVRSPLQLEIEFSRAPLRPEALFHRYVSSTASPQDDIPFFTEIAREPDSVTFRRHLDEPEEVKTYHIAEVHERAYSDRDEIVRGLLRGEIDFLPQAPLRSLNQFTNHPNWIIREYALPQTHLLQFHPNSFPARNQELRRALLYALDREKLLSEEILRDAPSKWGRVVTAPFPTSSYAASPGVRRIDPDLRVALSLGLAAAKANEGKLPVLRMVAPPDAELRPVIEQMILRWQRAGIEVRLLSAEETTPDNWDIAYRTVSMAEPLTELWPFLTLQTSARVADLQILPGWLRQQLIDLDMITNWEDAVVLLHRLHENLWDEVFLIPLWEVDRFMLMRRNIRKVPARPVQPYHDLETWIADPWYDQSKP